MGLVTRGWGGGGQVGSKPGLEAVQDGSHSKLLRQTIPVWMFLGRMTSNPSVFCSAGGNTVFSSQVVNNYTCWTLCTWYNRSEKETKENGQKKYIKMIKIKIN